MGLSKRQKNRIKSILALPPSVRQAIDDPDQPFSTKHGIVLRKLKSKYPPLKYARWVAATNEETLSVTALERRVHATHREPDPPRPSMFRAAETDPEAGTFRLQSIKIDLAELTDDERATLLAELDLLRAPAPGEVAAPPAMEIIRAEVELTVPGDRQWLAEEAGGLGHLGDAGRPRRGTGKSATWQVRHVASLIRGKSDTWQV